jgi:hypothetical protein
LMAFAVDPRDLMRRAADYVDRVLSGVRPADLPVGLPTKFKLIINLKTGPSCHRPLVASLKRPGTDITGISTFSQDLGPRRLELLREFLPPGATVAGLLDRANPIAMAESSEIEAAAPLLRLRKSVDC